jgi:hypothetical protein
MGLPLLLIHAHVPLIIHVRQWQFMPASSLSNPLESRHTTYITIVIKERGVKKSGGQRMGQRGVRESVALLCGCIEGGVLHPSSSSYHAVFFVFLHY